MKKLLLFLVSLISFCAYAQTFTELATANLEDVTQSSVAWGDYDNDGDLDVLLTGWTGSTRVSKIYTNTAGTFTELATANLTGVNNSAVAWGDYDNDGDLDVLLTGWTGSTPVSKIYTNTAGTFTELAAANLTGVYYSAVAWGDYDNDGDLDILLTGNTGSTLVSKIYTNTAGTFTELVAANLTGVTDGAVAWGDYDNDGDTDIVLTGSTGSSRISKIYTNTTGTFTELATANLAQVSFSSVDWGDYDNDGDLDILLTGIEGSTASTSISKIYTNTAGTFTELATANLTAVNVGSALWGDYDNDGDLDVLLNGWTPSGNISKIYTNTAGVFTELATANLPGVAFGRSAWGDFDNDGDLDILLTGEFPATSKIYTNNTVTPNTAPTAPTNPTAVVNKDEVTVSWTASTDAETPSSGLSYNVYIKDASTSSAYAVSPMAQENNGWRKLPALGNVQQNTSYTWKLPQQYHGTKNDFTFKVQAIDHSFAGSAFSAESTFSVDLRPFTELNTANLIDLFNSSTAWGDYDNDGDLDVLLTGLDSYASNRRYSKIYTNNNGTFTELTSVILPGVSSGNSVWGDYDNDGDLDILLSGAITNTSYTTKIYTNNGGTFTELTVAGLSNIGGTVAWGDYDNDGDLDILFLGGDLSGTALKIYTNTNGTFTELATSGISGIGSGSVNWGDYDNDGDLDFLLTGYTGSEDISKIYTNNEGVFTELTSANLIGVSFSSAAWGDYDNDGDLDILLAGYSGSTTVSKIYTNNAGVFTELATANLPGIQHTDVAWGDYDNDGDLDVLLTGVTGGGIGVSKIYTNNAGTFAELATANLTGVLQGAAAWGDYDNDNDLDILVSGLQSNGTGFSKIYTNNTLTPNTPPTAPTNPTAVVNGDEVTLSWTASTDTETPNSGLSYNVFIKDVSTSSAYITSPMAQESDGWRKLPAIGNAGQNTSYVWKLPEEYLNTNKDFTFKIQAIDHSFAGSEFSTEGTFSIVDLRNFIELPTANLTNVYQSAVAWGDYDNDGDLDLLVTGKKSISGATDPISTIYTNTAGTFTALTSANIVGVQSGAVEWGDYDNDGDLDLLITGLDIGNTLISKIYTNTGGSFTELATANLPGIAFGDVAWGDYDNDGDLDIFLTGGISKIFTNNAGAFTELVTASFPRLSSGSVDWGDYDNDGDLDVLLTGYTGSLDISKIYTNNNGVFTELTSANLTGVSYSSTAWGDYDNDGDLDILLSGYTGSARVTKVYTNTAGSFTELATANLLGVQEGSAAWGDYDNDGDLDILLTGSGGTASTRIYTNTAGVFTHLITDDLPHIVVSDAVWGDYDNDGDLDIALAGVTNSSFISKIYINNIATSNTVPTAPTNPTAVVNGDEVTLSWTASTDTETPSNGLSYNVYIKDASASSAYKVSPMAQENDGWRKLPAKGNAGQSTNYIYKLPAACTTNYTFKVQAVDHSFAGSAFSSEGSFSTVDTTNPTIVTQDITVQLDASGSASITPAQIDNGSTDNCGIQSMSLDSTSFDCTNVGANTVTLTVTDINGNSDTKTATVTIEDKILPTVVTQNITVQLDASGSVSITPAQIDNNSSDTCGIQSMNLDTTSFDCTMVGTNTVTLTVTDVNGNSASNTATVTVEDNVTPSIITQDITVQLDASGSASITPAQIDNGSSDACGIQSMSLDTTSFDCTNVGTNTVTLTVTDVNGNSASNTATVTVEDTVAPTVVTQNITVSLDATGNATITPALIDNSSSDNCGVQSISLDTTSFDCTNIGANTVTLTVADVNGNSASNTATVTVEDTIAPTVVTQNITVQLDASGNATITPAQIDNGSADTCGIQSMSLDSISFDCTHVGTNTVTLTVTDINGNSESNTATVTVEDTTQPMVVCQDITIQLDASGNATITAADIDNGSSDACGVVLTLNRVQFSLADVGIHTVTLTATDSSGNMSSCNALVTVEDNIPPVITLLGDDPQVITKGSDYIELGAITNDGSEVVIDSSNFIDATGTYYISYNATDSNGNMADEVIRTVIVNNPSPILEVFPNPASDYIRVLNFSNLESLEIYTMTGKKIHHFNQEQLQEYIKVDHLQEGIYLLRGDFIPKGTVYEKIVIKH
ncbi:FG-GAP-like repeat-containing protein [Aquimarina sp. 2304DJ70-9]|uniref:FG-GAP-like repeat-containing protein n=1 Tax=Aquimarina penaris TaxID=3231044 RepID=UPI0034620801